MDRSGACLRAAAHPALKFAQGDAVRCEECCDLVVIDRIGQNPKGLPGGRGETGSAQRQSEMLPGVLHRHHQHWSSCSHAVGHAWESPGIKVDVHGQRIGAHRR